MLTREAIADPSGKTAAHFVLSGLISSPTYVACNSPGRTFHVREDKLKSDCPARVGFNLLLRFGASPMIPDAAGLTVKRIVDGLMSIALLRDLVSGNHLRTPSGPLTLTPQHTNSVFEEN